MFQPTTECSKEIHHAMITSLVPYQWVEACKLVCLVEEMEIRAALWDSITRQGLLLYF